MQTFEIRDGIVQNQIVIQQSHRAYYERLANCTLVDAVGDLPVQIGDAYDASTGTFSRGGASLAEDMLRAIRNQLLAQSDFTQALDYPCTDEMRDQWRAYRQALRDMTNQPGWEESFAFPRPPESLPGEGTSMQQVIDELIGRDAL